MEWWWTAVWFVWRRKLWRGVVERRVLRWWFSDVGRWRLSYGRCEFGSRRRQLSCGHCESESRRRRGRVEVKKKCWTVRVWVYSWKYGGFEIKSQHHTQWRTWWLFPFSIMSRGYYGNGGRTKEDDRSCFVVVGVDMEEDEEEGERSMLFCEEEDVRWMRVKLSEGERRYLCPAKIGFVGGGRSVLKEINSERENFNVFFFFSPRESHESILWARERTVKVEKESPLLCFLFFV